MKIISAALAAVMLIGAVDLTATAAMARPHRHKVCKVWRHHHHVVRRCHWVR
jgi:hypothetical protein